MLASVPRELESRPGTSPCSRAARACPSFAAACSREVWRPGAVALPSTPTARGFEPLRAEPNGFLVHHLNHSVTLSCRRCGARGCCCGCTLRRHVVFQQRVAHSAVLRSTGVWRNGSASDSRSEGWEFESLCPQCLQRRLTWEAVGALSPCAFVALQLSGRGLACWSSCGRGAGLNSRARVLKLGRCPQQASCGIRTHDLPLTERVLCQLS